MKAVSNNNSPSCGDAPCVIDAPALIAYLEGTPQGKVVQRIMEQAHTCGTKITVPAVDMFNVYLKGLTEHPDSFPELLALLDQLPVQVAPISREDVLEAAKLAAQHQELDLAASLCIHFATDIGATLITSNPSVPKANLIPKTQLVYLGGDPQDGQDNVIPL